MNTPPIANWLAEWADLWRTGTLEKHVHVAPCSRLRRSLGRCRPSTGRVTIHPALFEPAHAELLREVVCHETAHAAVYLLHGSHVRPHGREWKTLVAGAGYPPTTRMDPRRLPRDLRVRLMPAHLYRHTCSGCGATRTAARRVRNWRCRRCRDAGLSGWLRIARVALTGRR